MKKRRMNPDFVTIKNKQKCLVEVKMPYVKKANYAYHTSIPFKQDRLKSYCKENGYISLWLDFKYDKRFWQIYKERLLSNKS
jgi:hypothetical protein